MAFYCWRWRAMGIGCPDCEEEYLRGVLWLVSVVIPGDGGSTEVQREMVQRFSHVPGNQSERKPWCDAWTPWGPCRLLCSANTAAGVLPHKPCELWGSERDWHLWFGVCLWHLALTPLHVFTIPPPHLSNNGQCEKTEQGSEEPGFRAHYMIRIRDQTEIQVSTLSMTSG